MLSTISNNDFGSLDLLERTMPVNHAEASWRNGALSDWSVVVGSGDNARTFRVHRFVLGLGERSSAFFYNHFEQPAESFTVPATTRLELGRALVCRCGRDSCRCSSSIRTRVAEVDTAMQSAFDAILEYMYEGQLEPSEQALLAMWALADYLQMDVLAAQLADIFGGIVSSENAHRLLQDCLRLKFGEGLVVPRCLAHLAASFEAYTYEELSAFEPEMVAAILSHPKLDAKSGTVSSFVARYVRQHPKLTQNQFLKLMAFLDDDMADVAASEAMFLVTRLREHRNGSNNDADEAMEALELRCFDSIAAGLDSLKSDEFAKLPVDVAVGVLGRDNIAVDDEDDVFRLIRDYVDARASSLSTGEIASLWTSCRFAFLSGPVMMEASRRSDVPTDKVMEGAILFKMLQAQGPVADDSKLEPQHRPRLSPAFDERKAHHAIMLSNRNRTARLSGGVGHSTLFSRQMVKVDASSGRSFYWEFRLEGVRNVQGVYVGLASAPTAGSQAQLCLGSSSMPSWAMQVTTGKKQHSGRGVTYGQPSARGDTIGVLLRCQNGFGSLSFYKNGKSMGEAYTKIQGSVVPAVTLYRKDQQATMTYRPVGPSTARPDSPRAQSTFGAF